MIIPIDIRHVLRSDSSREEYARVMQALQTCLRSCNEAWLRRHGEPAENLTLSRVRDGVAELNMDHVFKPDSHETDDSLALKAILDCMVEINRAFLCAYRCQPLYDCGARYARTDDWRPMPALIQSRRGDCKSLGPARCAELLEDGVPVMMVHRWAKRKHDDNANHKFRFDGHWEGHMRICAICGQPEGDGGTDFHILLMVDGKEFEDPSKILGMTAANAAEY
jgi:hypothetical protein